jgi:hypothetical protein
MLLLIGYVGSVLDGEGDVDFWTKWWEGFLLEVVVYHAALVVSRMFFTHRGQSGHHLIFPCGGIGL